MKAVLPELVALKENIDSRFKDVMPVVCAFAIFNANAIPNCGTAEFSSYESKEIGTLSNHYFPGDQVKIRSSFVERADSSGT